MQKRPPLMKQLAPAAYMSAQDLLLQQMQAQMAQHAAMMARLMKKMESIQVSRAGSSAFAAQVAASQEELDDNPDLVPAPQVIARIVKDKLPVIR